MLHVPLDVSIVHLPANKTLRIENCVLRVGVERVLRGVTDKALLVTEGDP